MTRRDPGRPGSAADGGSITVFLLLLAVALVLTVGLVAEGGAALSAREAAVAEAEQAARAGAAALLPASLRAGRSATGGATAVAAAVAFMAGSGHPGTAVWRAGQVTATVRPFRVATPMLALIGRPYMTVSASASAKAVVG